jgi:hypothetical protein
MDKYSRDLKDKLEAQRPLCIICVLLSPVSVTDSSALVGLTKEARKVTEWSNKGLTAKSLPQSIVSLATVQPCRFWREVHPRSRD